MRKMINISNEAYQALLEFSKKQGITQGHALEIVLRSFFGLYKSNTKGAKDGETVKGKWWGYGVAACRSPLYL